MLMLDEEQSLVSKLGSNYSSGETTFHLWAPIRNSSILRVYDEWNSTEYKSYEMIKDEIEGTFSMTVQGDLDGKFYTYFLDNKYEVTDPYCKASSVNSKKSAIIDLHDTDPDGFLDYEIPFNDSKEAIIYEVHIKDFTIHESSNSKYKGKYLGFIDRIDHLKELGITHVHFLPIYDFITVNEHTDKFHDDENYNWGYDPELYNVPEGSYSINPYDPKSRIMELKRLIMELHKAGISVIMDVVYNHTYKSHDSNLNIIYPMYYHRSFDGVYFSNGSGTGNEIASEREYVRESIINSVKYWQEEFNIDGFRFDLMALTDKTTMQMVKEELEKVNENIMIYGEPWIAQGSPLPYHEQITPGSQKGTDIGIFNPKFRDSLKGEGDNYRRGYLQGNTDEKHNVEEGIVGSIGMRKNGICHEPFESINYYNSHDNLLLTDKLKKSLGERDELREINKLAMSIIMTSQGIPFIHAGNEFLRDKELDHNSYKSGNRLNAIDWNLKKENRDIFDHSKDIINLRREYMDFFNLDRGDIFDRVYFIDNLPSDIIGYKIEGEYENLIIFHSIKWFKAKKDLSNYIYVNPECEYELIFNKYGSTSTLIDTDEEFELTPISTTIIKEVKK